jgi:hypothetical protein
MLIFWLVLVGNMTKLFNVLPTVHVVYRANLKAIGLALKVPHIGVIYFSLKPNIVRAIFAIFFLSIVALVSIGQVIWPPTECLFYLTNLVHVFQITQ